MHHNFRTTSVCTSKYLDSNEAPLIADFLSSDTLERPPERASVSVCLSLRLINNWTSDLRSHLVSQLLEPTDDMPSGQCRAGRQREQNDGESHSNCILHAHLSANWRREYSTHVPVPGSSSANHRTQAVHTSPNRYLLGIISDGPNYFDTATDPD